jgi:hypothetical protein
VLKLIPAFPGRFTKITFPSAEIATGMVELADMPEITAHVEPVLLLIYGLPLLSTKTIFVPFEDTAMAPGDCGAARKEPDEFATGLQVCPAFVVRLTMFVIPIRATDPSNEHVLMPPYMG